MREAFQALLRGDIAGRDRYCDLAKNIMAVGERVQAGYPVEEAIAIGAPICLPDHSKRPQEN